MPGFEFFGDEERREVQDVLDTGVLFRYGFDGARRGHWKARSLEAELQTRLGAKYAQLCSSGTAALCTALAACGIGAGDEVIVPPFTFIATVEAVLLAGAVPVFADIDETLCLDPEAVSNAIGPNTRAVIAVHMCGGMAQIDAIAKLCSEKNIVLIEDTAQAIGASYRGRALGTFGDMGCFSFDAVKTITCGEGGAVVTDNPRLYTLADQYTDHGHDHAGADRGLDGHPIIGTNYRICELNAAVGLAQLRKLDRILAVQRANKARIREALSRCPGITFRRLPDPAGDSATFVSFFLPDESQARAAASELGKAGVDGCFYWYDNNWHYLRKWEHLKRLRTPGRSPLTLLERMPDFAAAGVERSDRLIGRTLSMLVKLSWSAADLDERVRRITQVFGK